MIFVPNFLSVQKLENIFIALNIKLKKERKNNNFKNYIFSLVKKKIASLSFNNCFLNLSKKLSFQY